MSPTGTEAIDTKSASRLFIMVEGPVKLPIPPFAHGHLGTGYDVSPDAARVYFPHPGTPSIPRELGFAFDWAARLK